MSGGVGLPPHIVVDISGHGFGHAAMTLPVLEAVKQLRPNARLTVRSSLPERWLRTRVNVPFDYRTYHDFGMAMADSLHVCEQASLNHYVTLHRKWPEVVSRAAEELNDLHPDLVVSNISYLSLVAAHRIGIDRVAYSSLNWADVFWHYCGRLAGSEAIMEQMVAAYAAADLFLQPTPSMPMPSIRNGRPTGPVARLGRDRRAEIARVLRLEPETRIAVLSLGGIATPIDYPTWPRLGGWRLIVGSDDPPGHPEVTSWSQLHMPFIDILASADVLVTKPGYALFTEAVCNGKPLLYAPRDRWPETAAQVAWLMRHGRGEPIEEHALRAGAFLGVAERLRRLPPTPSPRPNGAWEVAEALLGRL